MTCVASRSRLGLDPNPKPTLTRYHEKLFKEYALADMSRHREGQVGLRWRTEAEVFDGKGQFVCGNKRCTESDGLASF